MNNRHISFKRLGLMTGIFFSFLFLITSPNVFAELVTAYTFEPGTEFSDVAELLGGGGVALDNLTCNGSCTSTGGVFGQGVEVGLDDYLVTLGSSTDLNPGPNGFTIAFYTYGIDVQTASQLVSKYSPNDGWYCGSGIDPEEIRGGFVGGGTFNDLVVTDEGTVQGRWRHIALTFDGVKTSSLYIDGVHKLTRNDVNFVFSNIPVYFGVASHDPDADWHKYWGIFDDVAIFDEPLSAIAIEYLSKFGIEAYMAPNSPPEADAGPDQTVSADSACTGTVTLDGSASSDPDEDIVSWEWFEDGTPLGSGETLSHAFVNDLGDHIITLVVTDSFGETDSDDVVITVEDTTPPELSVSVSPDTLWPPNHKMVLCTPTITATDNCDSDPLIELVSMTMNEADGTNDMQVDGNGYIYLRAERSGKGDGRVYTITYSATDTSGNTTYADVTVTVPHSQ